MPYLRRIGCRKQLRVAAGIAAARMLVLTGGCSSAAGTSPTRPSRHPTSSTAVTGCCRQYGSACYAPQQMRVAYGIPPLLDRGTNGRDQTVVLMEFANAAGIPAPQVTDIRQDLALFDAVFGLPAPRLHVDTSLAGSSSPWLAGLEEVEDAEIVHAIAPDAGISLILIPPWLLPPPSGASLPPGCSPPPPDASAGTWMTALDGVLRQALSQVRRLAQRHSRRGVLYPAEAAALNSALQADQDHHVTVVASSGDFGAASTQCANFGLPTSVREVGLTASDPLVLAVGGTTLDANPDTGIHRSESAWRTPRGTANQQASGGGFSDLFARPAYQDGIAGIGATRGVPDVAADASGCSGMTLAVNAGPAKDYFYPAAGTSAATPLWAALVALADQYSHRHLGLHQPCHLPHRPQCQVCAVPPSPAPTGKGLP